MSLRLEVIEFYDPTNRSLVQRVPPSGSADIKYGAQLIVQQNQVAIFFRDGQALDQFGPGRHKLETDHIPLISRLLTIPWEKSPFRALVYFVGMQTFVDQKWGTRQPLLMQDAQLGAIRLRAFGRYSFRVAEPAVLINSLVGTQGIYTTDEISGYLRDVILARLADLLATQQIPLYELPSRFDELSSAVRAKVADEFRKYGLALVDFFINSFTPPPELQSSIDARVGVPGAGDLRDFTVNQATQSLRNLATTEGKGGNTTTGLGPMLPLFVQKALQQATLGAARDARGLNPAAETAAEDPKTLVQRVAESSDWELDTTDSIWTITVRLGSLRRQRVLVRFHERDSAGHALLHFLSYAGPASEELAMNVLRRNNSLVHGAFAIEKTTAGEVFVVKSTQLVETADMLEISRAVTSIAWYADQLEKELYGTDNL